MNYKLNLAKLGQKLASIINNTDLYEHIQEASYHNGWFTKESIIFTLQAWSSQLSENKIEEWLANYNITQANQAKTIGLIIAGNIPLVGLHDIICILLTGHKVLAKLSHKDQVLYNLIRDCLIEIDAEYANLLTFTDVPFKNIDAIIATGSNNSSRYFDYYYGKYPNIIRRNRNSVAIIDITNTEHDFKLLAEDIFTYFGLGCRNVSFLLIPESFNISIFFKGIESFSNVANHNKYNNNYIYQQSIMAMNKIPYLDNGFCLLTENNSLSSPIGTIHFKYYKNQTDIDNFIKTNENEIQCVVSTTKHPFKTYSFGSAQKPALNDYADNIDTINFLQNIK